MLRKRVIVLGLLILGCSMAALAATNPPRFINYQGVLRDAEGHPLDGAYSMVFRFFNAPDGGDELLADPHPSVAVSGGLFNVELGPPLGVGGYLPAVFRDWLDVYLEVEVEGEILTPRTHITAAPYAMNARYVNGMEIALNFSMDLYVDAVTGNDNNAGIFPGSPKQTINAAIQRIPAILGGDVTVHIANGTYREEILLFQRFRTGPFGIRLLGNEAAPELVVLDGTDVPSVWGGGIRSIDLPVEVSGMTITGFSDAGVSASHGGSLMIHHCRIINNARTGIEANNGGYIEVSDCTISGNAHTGVWANENAAIDLEENVEVSNNGVWGLGGTANSSIDFGGSCSVVNNNMYVSNQSSISAYSSCTLTNASCQLWGGDTTSRCVP
jgi:hypothetical protein